MGHTILKADKQYRNRLFTAYLIGIAGLVICLFFGLPRYLVYLDKIKIMSMLNLAEISVMVFLACFIGPAWYLIVVGRKIMVSKRTPYPGQKVIHDTKIIEGEKAVTRGKILFILGIITIVMIIAGAARSHYFFEKFRNFNPFPNSTRTA
jgi:hypothetical protein